jgi:pilus assembly protein CpaB
MRAAIVLSLGTSVLLGTGALLIARSWSPAARPGPTPAYAAPATVPVVVAGAAITYGQVLSPNNLQVERFPVGLAPQGAYSSISQLAGGSGGATVALVPIAPKEPILPGKISGPGGRDSVSVQIAPGMRAYAIKISDVAGVGGHALPGDHVDVVVTREPARRSDLPSGRDMVSDVVVQDVRLLGVNLNTNPASTASAAAADPRTATLEVSLQDAQKLAVAAGVGTLSLALRRAGAVDTASTRQVQTADLTSGDPRPVEKPAPARIGPRRPAAEQGHSAVTVVQGEHDTSVSVPVDTRGGA